MALPEDYESFVIRSDYKIIERPLVRATHRLPLMPTGPGYLAGEFPEGTTTVEGVPVSAGVTIRLRAPESTNDGYKVAETTSAPDGSWLVTGLDPSLKYDVVGRKDDFNDVIVAGVTPTSVAGTVYITYIGEIVTNGTFTRARGYLELAGSIPPYTASVVDPLPAGLFPVVHGRRLIIDGTTADDDVFNSTVRITSSNGATKDVPVKLVVGFKAPANFKAKTLEDAGAFSVVLAWEVTNTTQEVLVFKSATPFDLESMPTPIATLTGDAVSYTDDDVIEDDVFYYMTASVCENYTLYSDEVREVVAAVRDPHWGNVVSLLHFDGSNGSVSFIDETGRLWAAKGGAIISSEQAMFGNTSGKFFGVGSRIDTDPTFGFSFGTGDFTVEGWLYVGPPPGVAGNSDRTIFGAFDFNPDMNFFLDGRDNTLSFWNGATAPTSSMSVPTNSWSHFAYVRESGVLRMFVGGVMGYEGALTTNFGSTAVADIGSERSSSRPLNGYLESFRITKGVARYTENFTPPTEPFPNK